MIEINLLPEELKKAQKRKDLPKIEIAKIPLRKAITIAVFIFVGLQLLAITTLVFKKNTLKRLDRTLAELDPKYKNAQSLKLEITQLSGKLSAINELTSKSILWSKMMANLSSAVTDGVWLTELTLSDEKGPAKQQVMLLKGDAISYPKGEEAAIIANFINSLKSDKDFSENFGDIRLESSQIKKIGDTEAMDFSIICYFKGGRSYFDRPKK